MATEKRLIDANHYDQILDKREMQLMEYSGSISGAIKGCRAILAQEPTVDAVEVVHGRWLKTGVEAGDPFDGNSVYCFDVFACSECGCHFDVSEAMNYCPNCGAKMDGGNCGENP